MSATTTTLLAQAQQHALNAISHRENVIVFLTLATLILVVTLGCLLLSRR